MTGRRDRFRRVAAMAAGIAAGRTDRALGDAAARLAAMPGPDGEDAGAMIAACVTFDDEIDMAGIEIPPTFDDEEPAF